MERKKIGTETIARTIVLALALLNQCLSIAGKDILPFAENQIYEAVTLIATVGSTAWAWWKNNSFTQNALEADEFLEELKGEEKE